MIVVDASAVLETLFGTQRADVLMNRAFNPAERARRALDDLAAIPMERHGHQALVARIWELRESMSAYDGAYIALAEGLGTPLLTCDAKLAGAGGHRAVIELARIQ